VTVLAGTDLAVKALAVTGSVAMALGATAPAATDLVARALGATAAVRMRGGASRSAGASAGATWSGPTPVGAMIIRAHHPTSGCDVVVAGAPHSGEAPPRPSASPTHQQDVDARHKATAVRHGSCLRMCTALILLASRSLRINWTRKDQGRATPEYRFSWRTEAYSLGGC